MSSDASGGAGFQNTMFPRASGSKRQREEPEPGPHCEEARPWTRIKTEAELTEDGNSYSGDVNPPISGVSSDGGGISISTADAMDHSRIDGAAAALTGSANPVPLTSSWIGAEVGDKKIKTIPMLYDKGLPESDDSELEEEERDTVVRDSRRFSAYFRRNPAFSNYNFKNRKVDASRLAVHGMKVPILKSVKEARVVIIEGFTGCGKTTQVPQFILDQCFEEQRACKIVVTQPRRIAAISVAKRICHERNWTVGSVVGYQVGMETRTTREETMLTFMTTGVLLQKLISSKSLSGFTHIIIDEVHERDLQSDFLLLVIKKIMAGDTEGKERHVKLILMSATIQSKTFEDYFVFQRGDGEMLRPRVIKIPLVRRHNVEEIYLDNLLHAERDLSRMLESNMKMENAMIQEEMYDVAVKCIIGLDDAERESDPDPRMRSNRALRKKRGAVLVFLPGMEEIKRLQRALGKANDEKSGDRPPVNERRDRNDYRWAIFPLHSSVAEDEQAQAFGPAGDVYRKIILTTNIVESSVTVSDVSYVIDFCLAKSMCVDETTNFSTLRMTWAAKDQCTQRKGRVGRVSDGKVYRLVTKRFFHGLPLEIVPEMKRSSLEKVILMCKKFNFDSPSNLLEDCLGGRPDGSGIERAVSTLKELGALTIEMTDPITRVPTYDKRDGDLTFVGKVMSELPIPEQCTKLILLGHCFGVMREAIIIAAGVSVKCPFQDFQRQLDVYMEKLRHSKKGSFSDLFALYHVYKFWISNYAGGRGSGNEYRWAKGAMVHLSVLREIKSKVEELEERLKRLGITDSYALPADPSGLDLSLEQGLFLKLAIAGAFYPRYFLRSRPDLRQYVREANKEVNGNDVLRTVCFKGFPNVHEGELYAKHVAQYLACDQSIPAVRFDGQNVFAIFDNAMGDTTGSFCTGMFRAIKLRKLGMDLTFRVLTNHEEERRRLGVWRSTVESRRGHRCPPLTSLPGLDTRNINVIVQHINSPSQFWVVIEQDINKLRGINQLIHANLRPIPLARNKQFPNALCLAPDNGLYYRAKIIRSNNSGTRSFVKFVDYGNSTWVSSARLCDFSSHMVQTGITRERCLAIECRLKELKPNTQYGRGWSPDAVGMMIEFCNEARVLEFEIFSIYQSIMSGELIIGGNVSPWRSLSARLLSRDKNGNVLAETTVETDLSMENYRKRGRARVMGRDEKMAAEYAQIGDPLDFDFMNPPTHGKKLIRLIGPSSPLEMEKLQFQACVRCSTGKKVNVDPSSINSILLDDEPTASKSRMLVAAHVSVTKSEACKIRDSTVMPPIPGILSLVSMISSPRAELRVDEKQSKYTGVLCGCGTVPVPDVGESTAVHPDNDMEIVFDTEIDDEDIDRMNNIRHNLNLILRDSRGRRENKSAHHEGLRREIIKLLNRKRKAIDQEIWPKEEYAWDRINPAFLQAGEASFNHDDIFQPHRKVMLNEIEVEEEVHWNAGY